MSAAKIFAGTGSQGLAEQICRSYGSRLGKVNIQRFSDGEILPTFMESIRGDSVFLIQRTVINSSKKSPNLTTQLSNLLKTQISVARIWTKSGALFLKIITLLY